MQNCRSLTKNLRFFQNFIYASNFKIIGLSETWLYNAVLDSEILPHGYTIYRTDRGSRGGGVMIAVGHEFPSEQIPSPPNLEVVTVSISLVPAIICCMVYIPPNSTVEYHTELINYLQSLPGHVIIFGDFNMPDIDWSTLAGGSTSSNNFCEFIFQSNLNQLVTCPTHKHGNLLDLILTDSADNIVDLTVHPLEYQCISSDHHLITFAICCKNIIPKPVTKETFNYAKGDYAGLNEYLLNCDFGVICNLTDVEEIWNILKNHILSGMNLFIPKVKIRVRQFPVWFTSHLSVYGHFSENTVNSLLLTIFKS